MGKCKVLLDTNVLMMIYDGIPVLELIEEALNTKCKFIVITPVIEELKKFCDDRSARKSKAAKLALEVVSKFCEVINYERIGMEDVDEVLIRASKDLGAIIATNDKELRRVLRNLGIPHVYYREGKNTFEYWGS